MPAVWQNVPKKDGSAWLRYSAGWVGLGREGKGWRAALGTYMLHGALQRAGHCGLRRGVVWDRMIDERE